MTDQIDTWITDTEISTRFPYYTRANADEVGPEPFSPLGWSLGWAKGCIPGVAKGFIAFGVVEPEEFAVDPPEVFGNWGGYFYNQLSLPRVMGVRMPGASPEAIDLAYFGDHPGVPPYTPHPDDENEAQSAKLADTMGWAMSTTSFPAQEEASRVAMQAVIDRPDLTTLSNAELVARARELAGPTLDEAWTAYCQSALGASLGPGAVQAICEAIGRGADAVKVMTAVGGIESADAGVVMWNLSRTVKNSPMLMAEFDAGVDGLLDRLEASDDPDAATFLAEWADVIAVHGHRGPNEWDLRAHSWTTLPSMPLGMLERMRHQDDAKSPSEAHARGVAERERLTTELLAIVEGDPEAHGGLQAGIASAATFYGFREMGKNACIRLIHEAKLAMMEVGRRMVADGVLDDPQQVFMLLDDEVDALPRRSGVDGRHDPRPRGDLRHAADARTAVHHQARGGRAADLDLAEARIGRRCRGCQRRRCAAGCDGFAGRGHRYRPCGARPVRPGCDRTGRHHGRADHRPVLGPVVPRRRGRRGRRRRGRQPRRDHVS